MPQSMRRQSIKKKKAVASRIERSKRRSHEIMLLREKKFTLREITNMNSVPKSTVGELKELLKTKNEAQLNRMLDESVRPGRRCVLTEEEEKIICNRIKFAASRGFAMDLEDIKLS